MFDVKIFQDALLAGDFNADCDYVCQSCWDDISLWTDDRFTWLLGNDVDSTVSGNTDCAYDRFQQFLELTNRKIVKLNIFF